MRTSLFAVFSITASLLTQNAAVAAPKVVASVKPLNSIIAAIMQGAGQPELLVEGAGSPHNYSLKPSKAKALQKADVIFWVGPGLEAFLDKPLDALAGKATVVAMDKASGITLLPARAGGAFEEHDDGDHHDHDHHDSEPGHPEHEEGTFDMHLWLDPDNAKVMAKTVADTLSKQDSANAALYAKNLAAFDARIDALDKQLATELAPIQSKPFIVFHDAYQYFEHHYKVTVAGSITVSPETAPGAKRVADIHDKVKALNATCIFAEPQFPPKLITVVAEGTNARTGVLDPLGADLADGPDLYPTLLKNMASALTSCLKN